MPNYKYGKITTPISDEEFAEGMRTGHFVTRKHKGLIVFLHYSALRISEALMRERKDFRITQSKIYVDVPVRLKHSKRTPELRIPLAAPFADELLYAVKNTEPGKKVWPYCRATGYNVVHRVFRYPHLHRLTRITQFFLDGYTIPQVKSWTGLSLKALDYYVGLVSVEKMGASLAKKQA